MGTTARKRGADTDAGRFYELQQEVAPARRGPYHLTADIVLPMPTRRQVKKIRDTPSQDQQLEILLGEQLEAVEELFNDRPVDEWMAFQRDYLRHFFGQGATDVPGGSEGS